MSRQHGRAAAAPDWQSVVARLCAVVVTWSAAARRAYSRADRLDYVRDFYSFAWLEWLLTLIERGNQNVAICCPCAVPEFSAAVVDTDFLRLPRSEWVGATAFRSPATTAVRLRAKDLSGWLAGHRLQSGTQSTF